MSVIRFVGDRRCSDANYTGALSVDESVVFDVVSPEANATLRFKMDRSLVHVPLSADVRDFVELALAVYVSDTFYARGEQPDRWTRSLEFLFPVQNPELWRDHGARLREMLSTLSGDLYQFSFPQTRALPVRKDRRKQLPSPCDAVCLFSGGFDSLLGAYALLSAGKRVLLVGHQAEGVTSAAQHRLVRLLTAKFPDALSFVQCRGAASRVKNPRFPHHEIQERTYRTRSFLFLALGVALARATQAETLYIPENGLIALNPPLGCSRIGSLSTRTAHPRFLWLFRSLVGSLGLFDGQLRNPFMYSSKTDLAEAMDEELRVIALESVSCSNTNLGLLGASLGQHHCGHCAPCLYRRLAFAATGIDRPGDYVSDAFRDLAQLTPFTQSNLRLMVSFAGRLRVMNTLKLQSLAMAHGWFPPAVGEQIGPSATTDYGPWADMLKRWATKTLEQLDELCSAETKRLLGIGRR